MKGAIIDAYKVRHYVSGCLKCVFFVTNWRKDQAEVLPLTAHYRPISVQNAVVPLPMCHTLAYLTGYYKKSSGV